MGTLAVGFYRSPRLKQDAHLYSLLQIIKIIQNV